MELAVFLGSLLVILTTGILIALVILICCLILMLFMGDVSSFTAAQQLINGTNSAALMAIPFFMLAGELMAKGGLSKRIVDFANIVVGSTGAWATRPSSPASSFPGSREAPWRMPPPWGPS